VGVDLVGFLRAAERDGIGRSGVLELTVANGRNARIDELYLP
jgi:hypothetical protein